MNELISPQSRKLLVIALAMVTVWMIASAADATISGRLRAANAIRELRDRYQDIRQRRVDVSSLERGVSELTSSPQLHRVVILADDAKLAQAQLQQKCRALVVQAHGQLISVANASGGEGNAVGVLLRARFKETDLRDFLIMLESGEPFVFIATLNMSLQRRPGSVPEIEVTSTLQAQWLQGTREKS